MTVETLNRTMALADELRFEEGPGGAPLACVDNSAASGRVSVHGAHVMHYKPATNRAVLWMSDNSLFAPGEPIRGGIPLCWPWFGAHPENGDLPPHGFIRRLRWQVESTESLGEAGTRLTFGMRDSAETRRWWDHAFRVTCAVTVGPELTVALEMENTDTAPYTITAALHTYLAVSDVREVAVHGFDGCPFIDTVGGANTRGVQQGPITVSQETDRILLNCPGDAWIDDPAWQRRLLIRKSGSRSAVVWNPWIDKSRRMPDFGDDEYPGMICVETTNAPGDERTLNAGETHTLSACIQAVPPL